MLESQAASGRPATTLTQQEGLYHSLAGDAPVFHVNLESQCNALSVANGMGVKVSELRALRVNLSKTHKPLIIWL